MLFSVLSQAGILSSLIFQTYALPFKPQEHVDRPEAQKRASYSVVEVDGIAANTSPGVATPTIETVTQTLKDTKTVTASPIIPSVSKQTITEVVTQSSSTKIGLLPSERATTSISSYRIVDSVGTTTPPVVHSTKTTIIVHTSSIGSIRSSTPTTTIAPTSSTTSSTKSSIKSLTTSSTTSSTTPSTTSSTISSTFSSTSSSTISSTTPSTTPLQPASQSCSTSLIAFAVISAPTASSNSLQTSLTSTSIYTTQPTITTTTYDDGLWHTFYPYPSASSSPTSDPYDAGAATGLPSLTIEVDVPREPAQLRY